MTKEQSKSELKNLEYNLGKYPEIASNPINKILIAWIIKELNKYD